jgi:hypothetical protein
MPNATLAPSSIGLRVDHWNTDNPHVHILIRGRAEDGKDLVISRAYISQGFRERAAQRVTLELGPRTEREVRSALEREVEAERWTNLDRALRDNAEAYTGPSRGRAAIRTCQGLRSMANTRPSQSSAGSLPAASRTN